MKTLLLLLLGLSFPGLAQVGVNTISPTSTLDVNGNTRIRTTPAVTRLPVAKDSILAVDGKGNVVRTTSKLVVTSHLKSFVKGGFSSATPSPLNVNGTSIKLPFNQKDFDTNGEYSTSTATFTATAAGIYSVSVQIKAVSTLGIATNFGVAILKNTTIIARSGYGNINVGIVTVSPPIRQVNTLIALDVNDTITFQVYSDLITAGLIGNREDSFFWIAQEQ